MRKLLLVLALMFLISEIAYASDAFIAYRSNSGACATNLLNCPKIRLWNSTGNGSWGSEIELPTASSPVRYAVAQWSPISDKRVVVTQSDDGNLDETDGCTPSCEYTCEGKGDCTGSANECTTKVDCTVDHKCVGSETADKTSCDSGDGW